MLQNGEKKLNTIYISLCNAPKDFLVQYKLLHINGINFNVHSTEHLQGFVSSIQLSADNKDGNIQLPTPAQIERVAGG